MTIDLPSSIEFGDADGLRHFMIAHRVVHESTSTALTARFGGVFSTTALDSPVAEEAWIASMKVGRGPTPQPLVDWLLLHKAIHDQSYASLAGSGTTAPDLSIADFWRPESFYDWMYVHQQMHDFEQSALGIS